MDGLKIPRGKSQTSVGFTLIELLVTLAILGVIIGMGGMYIVPKMQDMEAQTIMNDLQSFMVDGKHTALIRQNTVTLCVANGSQQCVLQGGEFLLSFIDRNDNQRYDAAVDLLNEHRKLSLNFGRLVSAISLNRAYIQLRPMTGNPIGYMGHIKYCPLDDSTRNMFKVSFNMTGINRVKFNDQEATNC